MERARTWIAFGIFIAVVVATGTYAYSDSTVGQLYVLAETLPVALIGACVNLFRLSRGKKAKWEFVFLAMAIAGVGLNLNSILSNYQGYRLKRELATVSTQAEAQQIIARSNSKLAREMDKVRQIAEETNAEIERAYASLNDPTLAAALEPANLENPDAVDLALKIAMVKHDATGGVEISIERAIGGERERVAEALAKLGLSRAEIDLALEGVDRRRAASEPLYLEQLRLMRNFLAEICAVLTLATSERGKYKLRSDGFVIFDSDEAATEYANHMAALRGITSKAGEISAKLNVVAANFMILQWTKRAQ